MDGRSDIDGEIVALRSMIDGSDAGLVDFMAACPYLRSADEARDDLARLIVGLEDLKAGRIVPQAQIAADVEARRRGHGAQAAE